VVESSSGLSFNIDRENKKVIFSITDPEPFKKTNGFIITTDILGYGFQAEMPFEKPDGTPHVIDYDYFGECREHPTPGPFQIDEVKTIEILYA
jgi:hypothetical protein